MSPNIQRSGLTRRAQVMLQAMREEPPLNSKCKDKFLIQSMLIPPEKAAIPLHDLVRRFLRKPVPT
jgi:vesicle-associated membrane protein-associated protein A